MNSDVINNEKNLIKPNKFHTGIDKSSTSAQFSPYSQGNTHPIKCGNSDSNETTQPHNKLILVLVMSLNDASLEFLRLETFYFFFIVKEAVVKNHVNHHIVSCLHMHSKHDVRSCLKRSRQPACGR